jgi:hypothetical protein
LCKSILGQDKLLEKTEEELNRQGNPFSIVLLAAHKALQKGSKNDKKQLQWKVSLVRKLVEEGYSSEKIRVILDFICYYVRFKEKETGISFEQNIEKLIKHRKNMGIQEAILTEVEEKGIEKGE